MTEIPGKKLSDKEVVSSNGDEIGKIYNITLNVKTGELADLVVEPRQNVDNSNFRTYDDLILIPFKKVRAIKDMVIVDT